MLDTVAFWVAAATLPVWIAGGLESLMGSRRLPRLADVEPASIDGDGVSIVVAARNEAAGLGQAAASLLGQQGVAMELLLIDDRSEDATGAIADAIAARDPRVHVIHIESLPPGWLGKNHALHRGGEEAAAEWILFTDADVVMAEAAVARAVTLARNMGLDHLAVLPELRIRGGITDLFVGTFAFLFSRLVRPWKAADPRADEHIGIGAFNLLRAEVYHSLGGHALISMRPDDDMMLGRLIKRSGYLQAAAVGRGQVHVEWYSSLWDAIRGLEKNAFAGLGYSVRRTLAACVALLAFLVWPFVALLVTSGAAFWLNLAIVGWVLGLYIGSTRTSGCDPRLAPGLPFGVIFICFAILRSAWLATVRGEVRWRGTSYSLEELRRDDPDRRPPSRSPGGTSACAERSAADGARKNQKVREAFHFGGCSFPVQSS